MWLCSAAIPPIQLAQDQVLGCQSVATVILMRTDSRLLDSMEAVSAEETSGIPTIHHFAEGFRGCTFALRFLAICLFIHKRYRFQFDQGRHRAPHIPGSGISKRVSTTWSCLTYFFIHAILVIVQELNDLRPQGDSSSFTGALRGKEDEDRRTWGGKFEQAKNVSKTDSKTIVPMKLLEILVQVRRLVYENEHF